jgi:hypothetical protein
MNSKADAYAFAYTMTQLTDLGLPDSFLRRHEIDEIIEGRVVEVLAAVNAHHYADVRHIAGRLFSMMQEGGIFEVESDEVAGDYFKLIGPKFKELRGTVCNQDPIILRAGRVGGRYFPEVFAAFEAQISAGEGEWSDSPVADSMEVSDTADAVAVPAADRVVTLNHNADGYEDIKVGLEDAIKEVSSLQTNGLSADEKSRAVATLKSASALFAAGELTVLQVKVGIMMAVEDIEALTGLKFKTVAGQLLLELIKAYFRTHFPWWPK